MSLGSHRLGLGITRNISPKILVVKTRLGLTAPVSVLSEDGDFVAQLGTNNGTTPTFTLSGGNGAFAIGDVPAAFWTFDSNVGTVSNQWGYLNSEGTIKGIIIADASKIDTLLGYMTVTISAAGFPDKQITIPTNKTEWSLSLDFVDPQVINDPSLTFAGNTASTLFDDYTGTETSVAGPSRIAIVGGRELPSADWDSTDLDGVPLPNAIVKGMLLDGTTTAQRFTLDPVAWYEDDGGTFFFEVEVGTVTASTTDRIMDAYSVDGSAQDNIILYTVGSNRHLFMRSDSATVVSMAAGAVTPAQTEVIGLRVKADDILLRSDTTVITDTVAELPVFSSFRLGLVATEGNQFVIKRMLYTPEHLSNAQISNVVSKGLKELVVPAGNKTTSFTTLRLRDLSLYTRVFGVQEDQGNEIPASFTQEILVTNKTEFLAAHATIAAGGCIRIQDGTYNDWGTISWTGADGTQSDRIYILPETLEGVKFTGALYLRIFPDYVTMRGFDFDGCSGLHHTVRFEGNFGVFIRNRVDTITSYGFGFYGDDTDVSQNTVVDCDGTCFIQPDTNPDTPELVAITKRNKYHHNSFIRPGPNPGGNAGSPISLGYGFSPIGTLDDDSGAIVEWNYFDTRADGEIVSIKSNSNIIRYNWVEDGQTSHISIRMGRDNVVYGNILTGMEVAWRWSGEDNGMYYNIVTAATSSSVVSRLCGHVVSGGDDSYRASVNNKQTHNILVGFDYHADLQTSWDEAEIPRPNSNTTKHNVFLNDSSVPGFIGQGLYDEAEYLLTNEVLENYTMSIDSGGRYTSISGVPIDFTEKITVSNAVYGSITIDPSDIPWLNDIDMSN